MGEGYFEYHILSLVHNDKRLHSLITPIDLILLKETMREVV